MVRKRYCCDYCDRSFPDSKEGRQKHMRGVLHQRVRKQHYDAFRDPQTAYEEEMAKRPCHRFFRGEGCVFGANCKYSHLSEDDIAQLQAQIQHSKPQQPSLPSQMTSGDEPSLETWLKAHRKVQQDDPGQVEVEWNLPPALKHWPNLPPSLRPPRLEDFANVEFTEWG